MDEEVTWNKTLSRAKMVKFKWTLVYIFQFLLCVWLAANSWYETWEVVDAEIGSFSAPKMRRAIISAFWNPIGYFTAGFFLAAANINPNVTFVI